MARGKVALAALWAALCVQAATSAAHADDASQARFHYQLASQHYEAGELHEAIREFFLVQQFAPNDHILYNIALAFESLGQRCARRAAACARDREQAFHWFSVYLAGGDPEPERHAHAEAAVERLRPQVALVRVESDPPGAVIYVDRRELGSFGVTPSVLPLSAGQHTLTLDAPGYHSVELQVRAVRGREASVRQTLRPVRGDLHVAGPEDSHVRVLRQDDSLAAEGAAPLDVSLAPGSYQIEVTSTQTEPWRELVQVRVDQRMEAQADPTPLPPPTATLTVTANATGAVVEIDGETVGFAPTVVPRLAIGAHRVRLRHPGLSPLEIELSLEADDHSWLTATLERPPVTTRSPATWGLGAFGVGATVAGVVTGVLSIRAHDSYTAHLAHIADGTRPPTDLNSDRDRGRRLALGTDLLLTTGLVSLAVATLLYVLTEHSVSRESAGIFSRGAQ